MLQYQQLLKDILTNGDRRGDRTGVGTISVFGRQLRFENIAEQFPLVTTKPVFWRGAFEEMLWFLGGNTNIRPLVQKGINIWNDWPYRYYVEQFKSGKTLAYGKALSGDVLRPLGQEEFAKAIASDEEFARLWGELGPVYGWQWRRWETPAEEYGDDPIDQIANLLRDLRTNPTSRRMIVQAWNPADTEEMAKRGLPPCHYGFQCYTRQLTLRQRVEWHRNRLADSDAEGVDLTTEGLSSALVPTHYLDMHVTIRSSDTILGLPFNVAQYAFLDHLIARTANMIPGTLVVTLADAHIYLNHVGAAVEQVAREPRPLPKLTIIGAPCADPKDYTLDANVALAGYHPHPALQNPTPVAV